MKRNRESYKRPWAGNRASSFALTHTHTVSLWSGALTHTPEALGRSAEQSQPPENLRKMAMENDRGEELGPSPATLRPL